jgi:hypothetical protein
MPRRKARRNGQQLEKQARQGGKRGRRKSRKNSKNSIQRSEPGPSNVAHITSTSGKTVRELVSDLSVIASQLGNLVATSAVTGASALRQGGQQAGQMIPETSPTAQLPVNSLMTDGGMRRPVQTQEAANSD